MSLVVDPSKEGFEKVLRDYQVEALRAVWSSQARGVTSREVYDHVNKALNGVRTISRASIINFLNEMCDEGVLSHEEETCKGGMRRKYFPGLSEDGFKKHIARMVVESLMKDFPEQTMEVLHDSLNSHSSKLQGSK